jgi:hypothetical protein
MEVSAQLYVPDALPWAVSAPGTHWIGPRAGLDTVVKAKIPITTLPGIEPQSSSL